MTGGREFSEVVFDCSVFFTKRLIECESSQIALTSLAALLISKPAFFVKIETLEIIQLSFASANLNLHYELLNMFMVFLERQGKRNPSQELESEADTSAPVDMKVLVGNAESFHEDGIPTSLLQSFLDNILNDVLLPDTLISASAFRVMSIALENGLVHPVKVDEASEFPFIIIILSTTKLTLLVYLFVSL